MPYVCSIPISVFGCPCRVCGKPGPAQLVGPIPEIGLYQIDKEAAKKISVDAAKQDESYIKSHRQYEDAVEEADFYRSEVFECERRAEDYKKEAESIIEDYWYDLFSEVRT